MLLALCKGVEKICIPKKIDTAFKKKNLVEKILDYTLYIYIYIYTIFYISVDLSTNYFAHFSGC